MPEAAEQPKIKDEPVDTGSYTDTPWASVAAAAYERKASETSTDRSAASMSPDRTPESREPKAATERAEADVAPSSRKFGNSTLAFRADGQLESIKLPTGVTIQRDPTTDKFTSTTGGVDSVRPNKEAKGIEVQWAPKNGVRETSFIRTSGVESVFDKPTTIAGVKNVTSAELSTGRDGKSHLTLRTDTNETHRYDATAGNKLQIDRNSHVKIDSPANLSAKDLSKGAGEVARILEKNVSTFGSQADRNYMRAVYNRYEALGNLDFTRDVNKALGKDARYKVDEMSIRGEARELSLMDRKQGFRTIDALKIDPSDEKPRRR